MRAAFDDNVCDYCEEGVWRTRSSLNIGVTNTLVITTQKRRKGGTCDD